MPLRSDIASRRRTQVFHRRTPGLVADLFIVLAMVSRFASETAALTSARAEGHRARVWSALIEVAHRQSEHQRRSQSGRFVSSRCCTPQSLRGRRTSPRATAADQTIPQPRGWRSEPART